MPDKPDPTPTAPSGAFASPVRSLAVVLLLLATAKKHRDYADKAMQAASDGLTRERAEKRWAKEDADIANLEAEAREMIGVLTGVPWDILAEANL